MDTNRRRDTARQDAEYFANDLFSPKRWSPGNLYYRLRLHTRRERWRRRNMRACAPFAKADGIARDLAAGPTLIIGDLSGRNGLSRASQYQLSEILKASGDCTLVDVNPVVVNEAAKIAVDRTTRYRTVFLLVQPDTYWRVLPLFSPEQLEGAYRIGHWLWETPLFPEQWRFALDIVHEIWTPSEFCRAAFRAGTTLPVHRSSYEIPSPDRATRPIDRAALGVPDDAFLGVAIMDIQSCAARKNPWAHVEAWQRAFGADPRKVLLLKVRFGKRTRSSATRSLG